MGYAVAVDIGGTFTDLVAYDGSTHKVVVTKTPTNYANFVTGILDCLEKAQISPDEITIVNHGTTLVINSLIQRHGARAALVTTKGFRDILEIARGNRPDPFDLHYHRDEPLIPRILRFEVSERLDAKGEVVEPLDMGELSTLAVKFKAEAVESVAIFFMNSYVNPRHEEQAAKLLRDLLPGVYITCSTELTREWYEYERASTVAANAYVGQQVSEYIKCLETDLTAKGFDGSLFMMGSNGGLLSIEHTCRQPIALVESGPIGGCIGACAYADELGLKNVIAFDMGGTTAKCALVQNGAFSVGSLYYAGGYVKGFPIRSPVIDIVEVGAGGGSIAWLDAQKRLHVGPQSAGSTPGPVCYGRGGREPTVTDANLILGRLDPEGFLGGELTLDAGAASLAMKERIAAPLGYGSDVGLIEMAEGVLDIAAVTMAGAIRQISVENGLDPRDFVLFSYGGGGPLHSSALAHELGIPTVIIPPEPGNFSAVGMLLADARLDLSKTYVGALDEGSAVAMKAIFEQLEDEAKVNLEKEFTTADVFFHHFAEMRYRGQHHDIKILLTGLSEVGEIRATFDRAYEKRYGHADAKAAVEFQTLHLSAFAGMKRPDLSKLPRSYDASTTKTNRPVHFGAHGTLQADVYFRSALPRGFAAGGPALIEEYGSTTVVWPNDRFEIGVLGEIRIHCVTV